MKIKKDSPKNENQKGPLGGLFGSDNVKLKEGGHYPELDQLFQSRFSRASLGRGGFLEFLPAKSDHSLAETGRCVKSQLKIVSGGSS
jgi:hypothetical protein